MTEAELVSELMRVSKMVLPNFVRMRHEDKLAAGWPDISMTGYGRTTWWEAKYERGDGKLISRGIQELTMLRLAGAGYARYIIYSKSRGRTIIAHPKTVVLPNGEHTSEWMVSPTFTHGFDHLWVAHQILEAHSR